MLGLGLGLNKRNFIRSLAQRLYAAYTARVAAAGGVQQNAACDIAALSELGSQGLLNQASWVLVPDGIEEDVVFAQKPTSGLGDLTFTRASDATYTDASGVVRRSPYNLVQFSEQFENAAWPRTNYTVTANQTPAPNGTLTADLISETTYTGASASIRQTSVFNANGSNTFSIYIKPNNNARYFALSFGSSQRVRTTFDFQTKTFLAANYTGSVSNAVFSYQEVGNGFTRIIVTADFPVFVASQAIEFAFLATNTYLFFSFQNSDNRSFYAWGAQVTDGSSALDYFQTTNRQDVPRIDFRNADGTLSSCGRLLLEPQRTNSVPYSEQFDNAAWEKVSSTITANTTTAPSGTLSADLFVPASGSTGRVAETTGLAVVNTTVYTGSIYFKKPALAIDNITFYVSDTSAANGANRFGVAVNLTNLTGVAYNSGNGAATSVSVIPVGDGWYRAIFTGSVSSGATLNWAFAARVLTVDASVDGINGLQLWGAQLETGAYATTYIPTTTAAVTRIVDAASKTGVSSLIGQTEGTIYLEILNNENGSTEIPISISNNLNQLELQLVRGGTYQYRFSLYNAGVFVADIMTTPVAPFGLNKLAIGYKSGNYALSLNGALLTNNNTSKTYTSLLDRLSIGGTNTNNTAQAAIFPTRLTNDQLEVLTSEGYGTYALLAQSLNYVLQ